MLTAPVNTIAAIPVSAPAMTAAFTATPGLGSASRASPNGANDDRPMARIMPTTAAPTPSTAYWTTADTTSWCRVTPRAESDGKSDAASCAWRTSAWPTANSTARPASAAKANRDVALTSTARRAPSAWSSGRDAAQVVSIEAGSRRSLLGSLGYRSTLNPAHRPLLALSCASRAGS